MSSPLEFVRHLIGLTPTDTVLKAPIGAWIPPQTAQTMNVTMGEGGRPVMDAAQAHAHNTMLFHGMAVWGPLTGLAIMTLAIIWTRFIRN